MASDASKALFLQQIKDISEEFGVPKHEAFPRWICQNILGIAAEGQIDEAVSIGGKNDYGVDIFYADENDDVTEQYVCCIQAKFSERLDHVVSRSEIESFAGTLGHLRSCPDTANKTFKQKSAEFVKMEQRYPHIQKKLIFAVTGRVNDQVRDLLNNDKWNNDRLGYGYNAAHLEILDLNDILSRMVVPHTPTIKIEFDGNVIEKLDDDTGKRSVIGHIGATSLVNLAKTHREMLFLENPRQTIGNTAPTHKAILNTLSDEKMRKKFWKLNNGITAICSALKNTTPGTYNIDNFKIVNGRQTTYTLENSTHPIDRVVLPMTVHEAVDDSERNQISEATNTQNPIKPADLVTNYPEMTDLVLQCRKEFCDFYFERQTHGFKSIKKPTKERVTGRRLMGKNATARAYYAYAISPVDASMPEKVMFSGTGEPNHYELVFKDRNIRDLIIPHIFMQSLAALHRKWCGELRDSQSDETLRDKGIISKDVIKYYILRFIYESMMNVDGSERRAVEDRIIEEFRRLKRRDMMPDAFLNIANAAYRTFMVCFNMDRKETWPPDLLKKIKDGKYKEQAHDMPTPYEIMSMLEQNGAKLFPHLLRMRTDTIRMNDDHDMIKEKILELAGMKNNLQ